MNSNRTVTATFNASPATYTLTLNKQGLGSGTVTSNDNQINCGPSCSTSSGSYASGASVILTETPASGSTFGSWSGCDSTSGTTCTMGMSSNRIVTATFNGGAVAPVLAMLSPSSAIAGSSGFALTVNGQNFVNGSTVLWNNINCPTTFMSSTQLQASVTAGYIASAGIASVTVNNPSGGGASNSQNFDILEAFAGTGGYLSMFVSGANLGNSAMYQQAMTNYLGFGTANPQYNFQLVVPGEDWLFGGFALVPAFSGGSNWNTLYGNGGSGFSLIGTAKNKGYPASRLDMGANATINFQTGDGTAAPTSKLFVTAAGNMGIGTITPATALQVKGDIRVGTSGTNGCLQNFSGAGLIGTCTSDAR
jgi:hypothetical protein